MSTAELPLEDQPRVTDVLSNIGRRQITAALFAVLGIVLIALVAPGLEATEKTFAFEPPPNPAEYTFSPPTLVTVVGVMFIVVAPISFLGERWDRMAMWSQLVAAVLAIPLILAVSLALSDAVTTNVTNLLVESLVLCTPIALGAMTGLWSERSGIINIGIEGMMLTSAGVGFAAYAVLGDATAMWALWFGVLIAVVAGALLGLLHAWLTVTFQINQIISGVVINLFALGFTGFLRSEVIIAQGITTGRALPKFGIPVLDQVPIIGDQLFENQPIFFMMLAIVGLTWLVMYKSPWGLRVRSCGENPHAAETLGIDVIRIRYQSVVLGGAIAGLGGAWFSMESQGGFEENMTNAAGFIALAAMIFGKWTPFGAFGGAVLFGFSRALGVRLQFLRVEIGGFEIPSEFWQALPFVVTLVVVAGAVGRAIPPAAEGEPYSPSK
jgi:simple sugar transport system permease protein